MSSKVRLVYSLILLVLVCCLIIPMVSYAWFSINDSPKVEDTNLDVVEKGNADLNLKFLTGEGNESMALEKLLPSDKVVLNISIENVSSKKQEYELVLSDILIKYPSIYSNKIIEANDYFKGNFLIELDDILDKTGKNSHELFSEFISPVSNAIRYETYYINTSDFITSNIEYMTNENKTSDKDNFILNKRIITSFDKSTNIPVDGNIELSEGVVLNQNGSFILDSHKIINLYMIVYFDPLKYVEKEFVDDNDIYNIILKNSNPYINQDLTLNFKLNVLENINNY